MSTLEAPAAGGGRRAILAGRIFLAALGTLLLLNVLFIVKNCQRLMPVSSGQKAPDFTVKRAGGGSFRLSNSYGHPVLLDFWATWCQPCKVSLPIIDRVFVANKDKGLQAIAIETDGAEGPALSFARQLGLTLPIGLGDSEVSRLYDIDTIPHLVLIDSRGQIRQVFHGVHSEAELTAAVNSAR